MADVAVAVLGSAVASPKGKKSPKKTTAKKVAQKPTHPGTKLMVVAAVKNLKERNGSSLSAIKKYIAANYKVDAEKLAPFVRKAVKSALASGALVQSKGNGASGSFKLPSTEKPEKKTVAAKGKKAAAAKPAKKLTKKAAPKKAAVPASPKKVAAKKTKAVKAKAPVKAKIVPKSPVKKVTKRSPTQKPKSPKPKKTVGRPKAGTKKSARK